jgi:tetratricopeptide (TPR) repeat protein
VLLSRIGEAIILKQLGNLKGSERALRQILAEAEAAGDQDAQARAHHDLGAVLVHSDRNKQAIEHLYTAFGLYQRRAHKLRALADLGEALRREGLLIAARDAFTLALGEDSTDELRVSAMIALLEITAQVGDRVGFAKWRRELRSLEDTLPPERQALFHLQVGLGAARFGQLREATRALQTAANVAERYGLIEYRSLAEAGLRDLRGHAKPAEAIWDAPAGLPRQDSLEEIVRQLHALRVAG